MKQIVIFNGSPRMDGNTATLLNLIAKGARDHGAEVKFYTLFKMKFMACQSCFACRMTDDCVINDELHEALQKVKTADAVVVGSPIYHMQMTGPVKNLYDRLYPLTDIEYRPRFGTKKMVTVYTQGMDDPSSVRILFRVHCRDVPHIRLRLWSRTSSAPVRTIPRQPTATQISRSGRTRPVRSSLSAESPRAPRGVMLIGGGGPPTGGVRTKGATCGAARRAGRARSGRSSAI